MFDQALADGAATPIDAEKKTALPDPSHDDHTDQTLSDQRSSLNSEDTARPQQSRRRLTFKESLGVAIMLAIVGFLFINPYYSGRGVIGNIVRGEIALSAPCILGSDPPMPEGCGASLPYRWIVVCLILFVSFSWYRQNRIASRSKA